MADNLQAPLARVPLPPGTRIVLEAIDPATGAAVAGVVISDVVITGRPLVTGDTAFIEVGPARLIPGPGA